ncbi:hypothetical protein HAPS_1797 [Glaesserella parasuis SH0165]|uniref:Uncharacterized protein n=1 Tax=Glaesserella parasuis serovar 5 (strain SH0165) TaxID=557723 RepID=B8F7K5_GLAP5|nr:hypothetical protein HAPS_1797 [Glaesserella parasuis SH0165]
MDRLLMLMIVTFIKHKKCKQNTFYECYLTIINKKAVKMISFSPLYI